MEETTIRKRIAVSNKVDLPIVFKMLLLSKHKKKVLFFCSNTSIAMRAAILCELALRGKIYIVDGIVGCSSSIVSNRNNMNNKNKLSSTDNINYSIAYDAYYNKQSAASYNNTAAAKFININVHNDNKLPINNSTGYSSVLTAIENEFLYKISQCRISSNELLATMSGEMGKDAGVQHIRSRIFKEMESKGLAQIKKRVDGTKLQIKASDIRLSIYTSFIEDCKNNNLNIRCKILIILLHYLDRLDYVHLQSNRENIEIIDKALYNIKKDILEKKYKNEEKLIFDILYCIVK